MTEEELRELAGASPVPEIEFAGHAFKIREDGLTPLLRFIRASASDQPEAPVPLSAIYRLISDCVIDFATFEAVAFTSRVDMDEIAALIPVLVKFYTARSHWPAMRLLGFVAGNLEELDGSLIRAGHPGGLASLSARQACNVALAACLDGRSEEDREVFLMDLMYEGDAASEALGRLRAWQAEQKALKEPVMGDA